MSSLCSATPVKISRLSTTSFARRRIINPLSISLCLRRTYVYVLQRPKNLISLGTLKDNAKATKESFYYYSVNVLAVDLPRARVKLAVEVRKVKKLEVNNSKVWAPLNLDRLQHWINIGRIDPTKPITMRELLDSRCVHGVKDGVKLLSEGAQHFTTPVTIEVARASRSAIKAIEKVGGDVTCRYFNRLSLRATLMPEKFWKIPKFADPVKAKDKEWYSNTKNSGYLAKRLLEVTNS
ncbi:13434_t:CDS:2 [Acaulospora morrowiae]|uniref:13434_t:CDS:1 n=1 Tax=Acaulospora morrowiae TaxID=94023 RepID=A0A9N9AUV6_9GLOM|nr:13434_t:CDS:2 [Acaulospora morrowiae]